MSQSTSFVNSIACPMPQLDFDVITLGHGGGGILTQKLLDTGVFNLLKNPLLDTHHDGAIFHANGKMAFSTDSYVISPIFFPGGNIGELAVNGTVNDLAMCGAIPQYLSLSFIIEEGLPMSEFWEILVSIRHAAARAGVHIVTGDTKVVEKGKGDRIFINTSGIGTVHPKAAISCRNIQAGDKVIVSGAIAAHGIAIMSVREGLSFDTAIVSDTQALNHAVHTLLETYGTDIHVLRDPTRGGVASTLNEIAHDGNKGIHLWQKNIPIDEGVSGACELLGLDPLYVANEGIFLAIVAEATAEACLQTLRTLPEGKGAAIIGEVTEEHPRQVVLTSSIGGRRVVNRLVGEQLPRIC
jgi:hydrogenase expression/formation protein HypE